MNTNLVSGLLNINYEQVINQVANNQEDQQKGSPVSNQNQPTKTENENYLQNNPANTQKIEQIIKKLQKNLTYLNTHLSISIDTKLDQPIIKIVDNNTNQVIREIPPEYMIKIAEAINELIGLLINKKV